MKPEDELARMRAEMDQSKEGLKEAAASLWVFYSALTTEGFAPSEAVAIVVAWFSQMLQNGGES